VGEIGRRGVAVKRDAKARAENEKVVWWVQSEEGRKGGRNEGGSSSSVAAVAGQ